MPPIFEQGDSLVGCFDHEVAELFCFNYVDDAKLPMCADSYDFLFVKVLLMASLIPDTFAAFLLKCAFTPKKTNSSLGAKKSSTKRMVGVLLDDGGWHVVVPTKASGNIRIGICGKYIILGVVARANGFDLDVANRVNVTKSAFGELHGNCVNTRCSLVDHHPYDADVLIASKLPTHAPLWYGSRNKRFSRLSTSYYAISRSATRTKNEYNMSNNTIVSKLRLLFLSN